MSVYKKAKMLESFVADFSETIQNKIAEYLPNDDHSDENYILKQKLGLTVNSLFYQKSMQLKKVKINKEISKYLKLYEEWSKQYSHKKFEILIKTQPFKYLFMYFAETVEDSFLNEVLAIKNNVEAYKQAILQIKNVVMTNKYTEKLNFVK